jgi:hypothetical protein
MTSSSSTSLPDASGLHDSVTMPCSAWKARRSRLLEIGVQLDLVDRRQLAGLGLASRSQVPDVEVAHTDRSHAPFVAELDELTPRVDVGVTRREPASG